MRARARGEIGIPSHLFCSNLMVLYCGVASCIICYRITYCIVLYRPYRIPLDHVLNQVEILNGIGSVWVLCSLPLPRINLHSKQQRCEFQSAHKVASQPNNLVSDTDYLSRLSRGILALRFTVEPRLTATPLLGPLCYYSHVSRTVGPNSQSSSHLKIPLIQSPHYPFTPAKSDQLQISPRAASPEISIPQYGERGFSSLTQTKNDYTTREDEVSNVGTDPNTGDSFSYLILSCYTTNYHYYTFLF